MRLKTSMAVAMLLACVGVNAHDFTATVDGQRLCFDIINKAQKTAAVTYCGSIADNNENAITGKVEIPAKVKHDNVVYEVTAIGQKAFSGANRLTGIVIPSGVASIGDFAFEGCDSLSSIVFPGNPVNFGQGVFFKCTAISDVTIGSDWKAIDLTMFRWSDKLKSISIPAKTQKIKGLKKLKQLQTIAVDANNSKFSSHNGMLYSKDGKTLFACPRAYQGAAKIEEGTETITPGSLIDCVDITSLDFPSSLQTLPFRETSRMKKLQTVTLRNIAPLTTAYIDGEGKFLLQIANETVAILIPATSKKAYEAALATTPGEYSETPTGVPYMVTAQQMPTKRNLKGTKDLDKK